MSSRPLYLFLLGCCSLSPACRLRSNEAAKMTAELPDSRKSLHQRDGVGWQLENVLGNKEERISAAQGTGLGVRGSGSESWLCYRLPNQINLWGKSHPSQHKVYAPFKIHSENGNWDYVVTSAGGRGHFITRFLAKIFQFRGVWFYFPQKPDASCKNLKPNFPLKTSFNGNCSASPNYILHIKIPTAVWMHLRLQP